MKTYDKKKLIDAMKKDAYGWIDELMCVAIVISLVGLPLVFAFSMTKLMMLLLY